MDSSHESTPEPLSSSSTAPLPSSREEVKLLLLLDKTESRVAGLAAEGTTEGDQKIHFYVKQLRNWLDGLEHHPQTPSKDVLGGYRNRVGFLQRVVSELTPPVDPVPRLGVDIPALGLTKDSPVLIGDPHGMDDRRRKKKCSLSDIASSASAPLPKIKPFRPLPRAPGPDQVKGKQIHQVRDQRHQLEDREELFQQTDSELRHRSAAASVSSSGELDDLLKAHHHAQEQAAEEMLGLTRALKEQTLAAGEIVRKDVAALEATSDMADKNTSRLAAESARLAEHTKTSCRCWVWFILLLVTITFIAMVMVMKIFRKRFT